MSVRSLNGLGSSVNVYLNRDPIQATEPVLATQPTTSDPITISLKGLSGFGGAGKVVRVNSNNNGLEYGDDINTQEWILSNTQLYPNSTGTHVVIGTTTNPNDRELYVNGDIELLSKIYFNDPKIFIENSGGYLHYNTEYKAGAVGGQHTFNVENSSGTLQNISTIGTRGISLFGKTPINSGHNEILCSTGSGSNQFTITNAGTSGGSPYVEFAGVKESGTGTSDYYYKWTIDGTEYMRLSTTGLTGALLEWKAVKIGEIYGGTNQSTYTTGDILYSDATNSLAKLAIGAAGKVLKVSSGGIPEWGTASADLTTATTFGTAATSDVKVGNAAGTAASIGLELYGDEFKLYNTSNVNVATFTPVSNTCNLTLNGGIISTATMGASTVWNGGAIDYNYGGTGLTSLTANKILQVNTNANGYNLVDMPAAVQYWSLSSSVLSPTTSTNVVRCENGLRLGTAGEYMSLGYTASSDTFDIIHQDGGTTTEVFEYIASSGFITWGTQVGIMNFNSYTLKILALQGKSTSNHIINESASGWRAFGDFTFDDEVDVKDDINFLTAGKNLNFRSPGSGENQSSMGKIRFNNDDDLYLAGQYETNSGGPGDDLVLKMSGGDIRIFRSSTPNSRAGNYDALLFVNPSQTFYMYGGGGASNIFLTSTTFDGNRDYDGGSSDDRLKFEEALITNATDTLMKLRPQTYIKNDKLPKRRNRKNPDIIEDNENIISKKEAGLIAQEVYYECPELRHIVITRVENEEDIKELPDGVDLNDIQNDPDYPSLGWNEYEPANVRYKELIPYLIKSNQEQQAEINLLKEIMNKLITAKSFAEFKKTIA